MEQYFGTVCNLHHDYYLKSMMKTIPKYCSIGAEILSLLQSCKKPTPISCVQMIMSTILGLLNNKTMTFCFLVIQLMLVCDALHTVHKHMNIPSDRRSLNAPHVLYKPKKMKWAAGLIGVPVKEMLKSAPSDDVIQIDWTWGIIYLLNECLRLINIEYHVKCIMYQSTSVVTGLKNSR